MSKAANLIAHILAIFCCILVVGQILVLTKYPMLGALPFMLQAMTIGGVCLFLAIGICLVVNAIAMLDDC